MTPVLYDAFNEKGCSFLKAKMYIKQFDTKNRYRKKI